MSIDSRISALKSSLPAHCSLIAVSKTHPVESIREAYDTGHRIFGENKVQELLPKAEELPKDIQWHMIGHLQSNKIKYIAPFIHLIHSVDSFKLLEEINKQGKKIDRVIPCLLQIHIATEESKFGFSEEEVEALVNANAFNSLGHVRIKGLMGMATFTEDQKLIRKEFKNLRSIFDSLKKKDLPANFELTELSMGMSSDYKIALEEGSTLIRVGTAIFGTRDYSQTK